MTAHFLDTSAVQIMEGTMSRRDRDGNLFWLKHGVRQPRDKAPVVGVDQCIGATERASLMAAGYRVVMSHRGEDDETWFARAVSRRAKLIISPDGDLRQLAEGTDVVVFVPREGETATRTVERFLRTHPPTKSRP